MARSATGFTLIELLVSSAIAMLLAGLAAVAFLEIRKAIQRAEIQMALNDEAQAIYMAMEASFACAQQSCAITIYSEQRSSPAPPPELTSTDTGAIQLIFMAARENKDNFQTGSTSGNTNYQRWQTWDRGQLCWETWRWQRATGTLHVARSRLMRRSIFDQDARYFTTAKAPDLPASPAAPFYPDKPAGAGGVGYDATAGFRTVAQPRRYLDPAHPFGGPDPADPTVSRLDDNMWFPDTTAAGYPDPDPVTRITKSRLDDNSTYKISEDVGDFSDLQKGLRTPTFSQITDLVWELVPHDETLPAIRIDDAVSGSPAPLVLQGVWLDGRLGSGATASLKPPQLFPGSDAARRPKLLRTRFTLTDRQTQVSQTFSFSFAWPGLAPKQ
jgi:Tfp pilus assembly protein PilE